MDVRFQRRVAEQQRPLSPDNSRVRRRYATYSGTLRKPWREDNRRVSNGEQVGRMAGLAMAAKRWVDFTGYWQRHVRAG